MTSQHNDAESGQFAVRPGPVSSFYKQFVSLTGKELQNVIGSR